MKRHRLTVVLETSLDKGGSWTRDGERKIEVPVTLEGAAQAGHWLFHLIAVGSGLLRNPIGMAAALLAQFGKSNTGGLLADADRHAMSDVPPEEPAPPAEPPAPEPTPEPEPLEKESDAASTSDEQPATDPDEKPPQ